MLELVREELLEPPQEVLVELAGVEVGGVEQLVERPRGCAAARARPARLPERVATGQALRGGTVTNGAMWTSKFSERV